jgi:hypothetical protein
MKMKMGKDKVEISVDAEVIPPPKAIRVVVEYDDGSVKAAAGRTAEKVMKIMEHLGDVEPMMR